ncbi:MAG: M23 family metallopeptidase [Oscillospiraceae bacterium]|nr:M23 family metallopeptidase [Oscillospiraceae bacterium]
MLFGGVIAAFLLLVTVLIAGIASSPFGIFFSIADDSGESIRTEVDSLSREFYEQVQTAMNSQPYDVLEIASDNGNYGVMWDEILPIYAVYCTTGDGKDVMSLTTDSVGLLRSLMNQLTFVSSEITVEEIPLEEEEADLMDAEEEKEEEPSTKEIRTLTVRIRHGDVEAYRSALGFTEEQEKLYKEITSERYRPFWAKVVGGYAAGGQNLIPYAGVLPKGIFSWPLAQSGSFNSGFGYRSDPFTGEQKFHGGIDLGAGEGIPILASADGTVSYANGTDTWGGGYGYYVLVDHGSGYSTLYGHCSAVCVVSGQVVRKGEVIAYVGSTGNSTGNHLHFEVRINGEKTDPMLFFGR